MIHIKLEIAQLRKCLKDMLLFVQEQSRGLSKICFEGLIESLHRSLPSNKQKSNEFPDKLKIL
jgi:hypothetical protein